MNYEKLESKLLDSIDETKFAQEFEQSSKLFDKTTLYRAIGAGASGTVGGIISGVIPGGLSFGGAALPSVIGGVIIKKLSKSGMLHDIGEGVMIAGIGQFIQNLIPSFSNMVSQPQRPQLESETESKETNKIAGVTY